MVGEQVQVFRSNLVVLQVGWQKVDHRSFRDILQDTDGMSATFTGPISIVWHLLGLHHIHRVVGRCRSCAAHGASPFRSSSIALSSLVGHQLQQIGVVDHGVSQQQLFLRQREVLILTNTPFVVLEPGLISTVGCNKQRS